MGPGSPNFHFDLVFFPAACFLSVEGFSVVAAVAWVEAIGRRVINLLPDPSLPGHNWRVAVGALGLAANDHRGLHRTGTHIETRFSRSSEGLNVKNVSCVCHRSGEEHDSLGAGLIAQTYIPDSKEKIVSQGHGGETSVKA